MKLSAPARIVALQQFARRHRLKSCHGIAQFRDANRNHMLGKAHDPELRAAGHAFEALAVVEGKGMRHAVRRERMPSPIRHRNLYAATVLALNEYVRQRARPIEPLGIYDGASRAAKSATESGGDSGAVV